LNSQSGDVDEQITQIKQRIMNEMKEAEALSYQGNVIATWKAPKPSFRLDSKRLEAEEMMFTSALRCRSKTAGA
jgi:hypothetical protein